MSLNRKVFSYKVKYSYEQYGEDSSGNRYKSDARGYGEETVRMLAGWDGKPLVEAHIKARYNDGQRSELISMEFIDEVEITGEITMEFR